VSENLDGVDARPAVWLAYDKRYININVLSPDRTEVHQLSFRIT